MHVVEELEEDGDTFETWRVALLDLAEGVRKRIRPLLLAASERGDPGDIARPVGQGVGDVTFGLDLPAEESIDAWISARARRAPLSVLTEDRGWRHLGPREDGGVRRLTGFAHGGPRIVVDPVDGTRNLMSDLRAAWTVVGFAPPGERQPHLSDLTGGVVAELPTARSARFRVFVADRVECACEEHEVEDGARISVRRVRVDEDDRVDQGYFPFFRYDPRFRPQLARVEAAFFARLEEHAGAELRSCYDDQYISSAGQLVHLMTGTYRMIVDARAHLAGRASRRTTTSKPYDLAGAVVCARAAGALLTATDGSPLDFPLDAETPIGFVGYANAPSRVRMEPHLLAALADADAGD